ncbi:MAG: C25 family cysteine peptidase [Saprospiraceae bacterium]|nr:C25 family cysteine peptidase [Saprospiraceae bacterium]
MAIRHYLILLLCIFGFTRLSGQMVVGPDTLIGNEWITYGQQYFKFTIDADGVYRIPYATLAAAGISTDAPGSEIRIYSMGKQVPLYVSTDGVFGTNDFIEFYGFKNKSDLDHHLFRHPDTDMLHPGHSMYTDLRVYFLTVEGNDPPLRVNTLVNNITNPPTAEPYYIHRQFLEWNDTGNDPYLPISGGGAISYSSYLHGEGFGKASESNSTTEIVTSNKTAGPDANLRIRLTATNHGNHNFVVTWNGTLLDTIFAKNIEIRDITFSIPLNLVQDINQINISNTNSLSRHSLVTIELAYPRIPDAGGSAEMLINPEIKPGTQYFVLDGFLHNGSQPILYASDGQSRMMADINGNNQVHFLWPEVFQTVSLRLTNPVTSIHIIPSLTEKIFADYTNDDTEYIVITHPDLMEVGTESEYIQYRSSAAGGSYRAKAYSILELYDEFGYGIEKHPQAIRNFVEFVHRKWPAAKMFFIIGRGIEYNRSRYANGTWEAAFFVPTFGRPGSDNLLAATLWDLLPRYPIGRLAITKPGGIDSYLRKVKEHDLARFEGQTLAEKKWIKNVMHLGGGKDSDEQNDFEAILKSLGDDLASSGYGANISFFQKESTDEIGESESAQILKLLNEGCGVINYLGHSASSTFEFNINDPSEWNNKGRYPIFSAMGCSAGQIHGTLLSLSDNYVQIEDEGTVAFISGSGSQFGNALVAWCRPWYNYFGNLNYGTTLGESVLFGLKTLTNFINLDNTGSNSYRYLLEQQTFQGDPALLLHPFPGPDYTIDANSISFSPNIINTKLDSFKVTFSVANLGRNLSQEVGYTIKIKLPDGQILDVKADTVLANGFLINITAHLPLMTGGKTGTFRLLIAIDPDQHIEELPAPDAENNNSLVDNLGVAGIEFFVVDDLITAAYPPDFSIVTTLAPELTATGSNAFSKGLNVVFEMDTTPFFNSLGLVRETYTDHSSILKWSPQTQWVPDQVYYWRVSTDSMSAEQSYNWSRRSFIYQPGNFPGWNQSDFHQFTDNLNDQLLADSTNQSFLFSSTARNFSMLNRFHHLTQSLIPRVTVDGIIKAEFFTGFRNRNVQLFVVAIDSLTGDYIYNPNPGLYGSANHLSFDAPVFPYRMDVPESRQALINFVENVIPAGYYVFIYSYQQTAFPSFYPEQWESDEQIFGKSIFSMIENQYPSSAIRTLATEGSKPFIIYFQKDRGGIQELIAADTTDAISLSLDIQGSLTTGAHISQLVGPSTQWYSILSETHVPAIDTVGDNILSAIALSADFSDTLLISSRILSQDTTIADIDASIYPYIRLTYRTQDSVTYDPVDLVFWRVLYDGYPELIIQPNLGFEFIADTLTKGEKMRLSTYVENVSPYPIDTLPVSLRIISANNTTEELTTILTNLKAYSSLPVVFEKNTDAYEGDYQILMEVNPRRMIREFNYNNNIGTLPMHVKADDVNPLLDVTFDGYHIEDGDLVGSNPLIMVQLTDENTNLRLDDTSLFILHLEYPSDIEPQRIYFTEPWVRFIPSPASGANMAAAELTPLLTEDGIYTFRVQANDASGNDTGDNAYMVSFEVMNASSVSSIYNYPNPFSSSTRFIYTMTGPGSPPFYKIDILSITGVLVREITQEDLGALAPGDHMTEYAWDGTDQNGNELAAGIYLYRLVVKDENMNDYPSYSPYGKSEYKNKGWGKLVLVR